MAKSKKNQDKKVWVLRVSEKAHTMVGKVAGIRNMSIEQLFDDPDVVKLWEHLYLELMEKEKAAIKSQKPA